MIKNKSAMNPIKRIVFSITLAAFSLVLLYLSRLFPEFANWYTDHIYSAFVNTIGRFWGLFPFSAVEFILYLMILLLLGTLFYAIYRKRLAMWGADVLFFASILFITYTLCCGINYNHSSFSETTGIVTSSYTADELASVCELLTEQLNTLAPEVSRAEDGTSVMGKNDVPKNARKSMENIGTLYDELDGYYPVPKPLTVSEILSYQNLSGIYSPFTIEANYNNDMTDYNLPFTACHELSHLRGFMQEEEANFIAFLACIHADSTEFQYSGYMLGWLYATNQLYHADYEAYEQIYSSLNDQSKTDLAANTKFWDQYEGQIAEVSNQINDSYLKANGQDDGVASYDRMVDLMMAYYAH